MPHELLGQWAVGISPMVFVPFLVLMILYPFYLWALAKLLHKCGYHWSFVGVAILIDGLLIFFVAGLGNYQAPMFGVTPYLFICFLGFRSWPQKEPSH